jgi:hypothetical protein
VIYGYGVPGGALNLNYSNYTDHGLGKGAATQSIAFAMFAMFAMHGKIAAFTYNVTGHTVLRTLCSLCWLCSHVAELFDSWIYFKT